MLTLLETVIHRLQPCTIPWTRRFGDESEVISRFAPDSPELAMEVIRTFFIMSVRPAQDNSRVYLVSDELKKCGLIHNSVWRVIQNNGRSTCQKASVGNIFNCGWSNNRLLIEYMDISPVILMFNGTSSLLANIRTLVSEWWTEFFTLNLRISRYFRETFLCAGTFYVRVDETHWTNIRFSFISDCFHSPFFQGRAARS